MTFAVRICPDCNAERRIQPCPLCRGEGRVAITPYPRRMNGQYPLGVYPEIVPEREVGECALPR